MSKENKHLVLALIRCVTAGAINSATLHQIVRFESHYMGIGDIETSRKIRDMLTPSIDENNFKIVQS